MKGTSRNMWMKSCTRELVHCNNSMLNDGTSRNSFRFIPHHEVSNNVIPTYGKQHHSTRPNKVETHRNRLAVSGDKVHYDGSFTLPTTEKTLVKMKVYSTISAPSA